MQAVLDRSGEKKLYIQLAELIRAQIKNDQLKAGDLLPTEDAFCRTYSVSKAVVRQAMMELAREGWVIKRQGVGTFAAKPKIAEGPVMLVPLTDRILDFGAGLDTQVVYKGVSAVPSNLAVLFQGDVPDQMFKLIRVRRIKGRPALLETAYVISRLCPGLALDDLKSQSLFELIEKRYHLRIDKVATSFDLTPLGEREAQLLKESPGKMAILYDQVLFLEGGQVLGLIRSICPEGKSRISFEWTRRGI
jgi:GntR family transcriptional regulator